MAKYNVKCPKCGKVYEVELFGKIEERYKKIEWMEKNKLCPECWKAAQPNLLVVKAYKSGKAALYVKSTRSYEIKDELKAHGYRWDANARQWYLVVPEVSPEEQTTFAEEEVKKLGKWNFELAVPEAESEVKKMFKQIFG